MSFWLVVSPTCLRPVGPVKGTVPQLIWVVMHVLSNEVSQLPVTQAWKCSKPSLDLLFLLTGPCADDLSSGSSIYYKGNFAHFPKLPSNSV